MSLQMHMKIEGVFGEATSYKHKGWCEIISWNWGMTSNRKTSNSGDDVKTMMNELTVIKPIGTDSTEIRNLYAVGNVIPNTIINIAPVVGKRDTPKNYVDIIMENVIIKSVVTGGSFEDSFFKEHITLIFDRVTFECNKPIASNADEDPENTDIANDFRWDVNGNKKWAA